MTGTNKTVVGLSTTCQHALRFVIWPVVGVQVWPIVTVQRSAIFRDPKLIYCCKIQGVSQRTYLHFKTVIYLVYVVPSHYKYMSLFKIILWLEWHHTSQIIFSHDIALLNAFSLLQRCCFGGDNNGILQRHNACWASSVICPWARWSPPKWHKSSKRVVDALYWC